MNLPDHSAWYVTAAIFALAILVVLLLHFVAFRMLRGLLVRTGMRGFVHLVDYTRIPVLVILLVVTARIALPFSLFPVGMARLLHQGFAITVIAAITYLVIRLVRVGEELILESYRVEGIISFRERRVHTQTRVLSRTLMFLVALIGLGAILMTFPEVRQFGASILASAGLAGLVMGFAARPVLGNLIAGMQIALSQPVRLDDVVVVEGQWGRIEEITTTYVVVRIWDDRRLIVPLQYFIEHPFENWTRKSTELLGTVFIYTDYTVPVEALRQELQRIVKEAPEWDGRTCTLLVTDAREHTLELRALVSAADADLTWDLRCRVREKLIEYLQRTHPGSLPRTRAEITSSLPTGNR